MLSVNEFKYLNRVVYYPEKSTIVRDNSEYRLVEIDIKSAYPNLLKIYFEDVYFDIEKNIEEVDEKIVRNILISTGATEILTELQNLAKDNLLQFVEDILGGGYVIEFKKDGGIFLISEPYPIDIYEYNLLFFKVNKLNKYLRYSNTSFYYYKEKDNVVVKGKYKYIPTHILNFYNNKITKNKILDLYSNLFKTICEITNNIDELTDLFLCYNEDNKKLYMLDEKGKYIEIEKPNKLYKADPMIYKSKFIFPFIKLHVS